MKKFSKSVVCLFLALTLIMSGFTFVSAKEEVPVEKMSYMEIVKKYVDTVLEVGRNVEGSPYPLLFADGINSVTKEPVVWYQDGNAYVPSNLASQQNFLRVLDTMTDVTGDAKYENMAKEQIQFYFDNLTDDSGLAYWGGHQWVDLATGNIVGEQESHEFKGHYPYYKLMFETDPEATQDFIEAMWNAHISDWSILSFNRHGKYNKEIGQLWDSDYNKPEPFYEGDEKDLTFINAGSDLIYAAMMLYMNTGDERPHMWAKRLFQQYMDARDPVTKLGAYQFSQLNAAGGGDRAQAQFGPEFGERALDGRVLLSASTAIYGQAMLSFMYAADKTNDSEMMNTAFECLQAFYKHAYVPEVNKFTPMFTDGTSLLGYESPREGYYGNKGHVFDYINVSTRMALSSTVASRLSNADPIIWEGTRNVLKGYGLGDIGTAPGVNVAVDLNTTAQDPVLGMCAVELYHFKQDPQYLKLAEKICDNIIQNRFKDGLFVPKPNQENIKLSTIEPMLLIAVEAARQGKFESIDYLCISDGYIHGPYDGIGRAYDSTALYGSTVKNVESVSVEKNSVTLVANNSGNALTDINGHWAEDVIAMMNSKGVMKGTERGFEPDRQITRAEFIALINRLFSIDAKPYQGTFYDVSAGDWFAGDVEAAYSAGIIDPNIYKTGALMPDKPLTREEMASIIAKVMKKKIEATYAYGGSEENFADSAKISGWAKEYVDICVNWNIMEGMTETTFAPGETATRAQACAVIKRLDEMIEKPLVPNVNAVIFPENATDKRITYTSSNTDVVIVDANGYMYGVAPGNAVITVNASGKTCDVNVQVLPAENWMLSGIYLEGNLFEGFDTFNKEYALDLVKGTTEIPEITAKDLNGATVKVYRLSSIPGTVEIGSGDNKYIINVTANGIDYAVNEDFSIFELETPVDQQMHGEWQLRTNSYGQKGKTAQVNVVENPLDKSKKSAYIDLKKAAPQIDLRVNFPQDMYVLGDEADDDFLAYEVSFMQPAIGTDTSVKNTIALYDEKNSQVVARFQIIGSSIYFNASTSSVSVGNIVPGKEHTLKVVMNKKLRTVDIYFDDKVIETNVLIERAVTASLVGRIAITVLDPTVQMYVNKIQVYTIPENVYETPVIETTDDEEAVVAAGLDKPFADDFSTYTLGAPIDGNGIWTSTNGEVIVGNPPRGGSKKVGIFFPEIVDEAGIDYTVNSKSFGNVKLGENADDKKLVFEFDAMPGNDTYISLLSGDTGSTYAFRMFFQGKKNVVHCSYTSAGAANDTIVYDRLNSKRVYRMKIVIDKQKKEADIYINDSLLLGEAPLYGNRYGEDLSLSRIQIATRTAGTSEFYESHSAGWFGNFNIYEEENY